MIEIYKKLITSGFNKVTINDEFIEKDDLFVMLEGKSFDIYSITEKLLSSEIKFLISQKKIESDSPKIIYVPNTKVFLEGFVNYYQYDKICNLNYFGVTGTNGKTTTSMMFYDLMKFMKQDIGYLGTLGIKYKNINLGHNEFTTPPINMLYNYFSNMVDLDIKSVIMETSAQGFDSNRLSKLKLNALAWLNFQQLEHGEYYKSYDEYFEAKLLGFKKYLKEDGFAIIPREEEKIFSEVSKVVKKDKIITFGKTKDSDVYYTNYKQYPKYQKFDVVIDGKVYKDICLHMQGEFAPLNLLVCICFTKIQKNLNLDQFMLKIQNLRPQKANFEFIEKNQDFDVVLDTTHTIDGYKQTLSYIKNVIKPKRLIHVFGAHGYRDVNKRPIMGKTSEKYSDLMILTSDYSRDEDQMKIINDIIGGICDKNKYIVEQERKKAIQKAIQIAQKDDLIFISGKAPHEYEEFENLSNKAFKMSDYECACNAIEVKNNG